jgi:hypothetical protein
MSEPVLSRAAIALQAQRAAANDGAAARIPYLVGTDAHAAWAAAFDAALRSDVCEGSET